MTGKAQQNAVPEPPHCNHFVTRKKRFCRMTVRTGDKFCGEHQPPSDTDAPADQKIRVVCPLDRKHTCYAHNLAKHLKICNARPKDAPPYIQKGVNSGQDDKNFVGGHKLLSEFSAKEVTDVVAKINKVYAENLQNSVTNKFTTHKSVEEEISKPEYGDKSKKHLKQASAILGLLTEYNLIKPETCYIEFGAGRGHLSFWLAQTVDPSSNSCFLLVERSSPKHKRDNKLDKTDDKVQRIRADIADLVLNEVEAITKTSSIVGVTKHLCGDATDLALRCLANVPDRSKLAGCIMTFCCHHRCRWGSYTGKEFFDSVDLTQNDFEMMCAMGSWATCGTGFSRERNNEVQNVEVQSERDREIGLSRVQKEEVGKKCKAILNWGRLKYVQGLGFKGRLHYYVGAEVSLENVCIVAYTDENIV